jgi:hypothetical protein
MLFIAGWVIEALTPCDQAKSAAASGPTWKARA